MNRNQVAMIAAVLGIEEPRLINSGGMVYPTKVVNDIRNHKQRLADAKAKRERRAEKQRKLQRKLLGLKADMIVVDEIEP